MSNQSIDFSQGRVSARDPSTLRNGELVTAQSAEYRLGSPHVYKEPGRLATTSALNGGILGLHRFQYDSVDDVMIAVTDVGAVEEGDVFTTVAGINWTSTPLTGRSTTAIPKFANFKESWVMVNGVDANYIREPNAVPTAGWANGNWRPLGMGVPSPEVALAAVTGVGGSIFGDTVTNVAGSAYSNAGAAAYDSGANRLSTSDAITLSTSATAINTFEFSTNLAATGRWLRFTHQATAEVTTFNDYLPGYKEDVLDIPDQDLGTATVKIEYSVDNGSNWTQLALLSPPFNKRTHTVDLASVDGNDVSTGLSTAVIVRATFAVSAAPDSWYQHRIYNIAIDDGASDTPTTISNALFYFYTERYTDADGVVHESAASPIASIDPAIDTDLANPIYGITVSGMSATPESSFATEYVIYRSLDESGGGFPFMYEIDTIAVGATTYVDTFETSLLLAQEQKRIYPTLTLLGTDGQAIPISKNTPPPKAIDLALFQGSMVYVPVDSQRLYYSLPTTVTSAGAGQVPALYYLTFQSPNNDVITAIQPANNGLALIVYFESHTMLVNYLPQAADPGIFDTRVKEYVSNTRGACNPCATCEITLESGSTLAVAVDDLGVWATDGVSIIMPWSIDMDWAADMADADSDTIQLFNNPEKRRVEMLYSDGANWYEYFFFYGRLKQDGDGNPAPIITGPTQRGFRCRHYATVDCVWTGWSGDAEAGADFTPLTGTSATLELWLDANDNDTFKTSGGGAYTPVDATPFIGTWQDKSGNARHVSTSGNVTTGVLDAPAEVTEAIGLGQDLRAPDFASGIGSLPEANNQAMRFYEGGASAYHNVMTFDTLESIPHPWEVVAVYFDASGGGSDSGNILFGNSDDITGGTATLSLAGDAFSNKPVNFIFPSDAGYKYSDPFDVGDQWNVQLVRVDSNVSDEYFFSVWNNYTDIGDTTPTASANPPGDYKLYLHYLGSHMLTPTTFRGANNFYVAEIMVFSGTLTDTDRQTLSNYLANKYDLTDTTPGNQYTNFDVNDPNLTGDGDIYIEGSGTADESEASGSTDIDFHVKTGDFYVGGLGRAAMLNYGYPKFEDDGTTRTLDPAVDSNQTLKANFRRDGYSSTKTKSKSYNINAQKKVYWHCYADRHSFEVLDHSAAALPGLVGYEVEVRDTGTGRDD